MVPFRTYGATLGPTRASAWSVAGHGASLAIRCSASARKFGESIKSQASASALFLTFPRASSRPLKMSRSFPTLSERLERRCLQRLLSRILAGHLLARGTRL